MNIQQMMQQAKVMQDKMQQMQAELSNKEVHGSSGGGMIQVTMTCKGECRALTIDPSLIKEAEKEILEDLIKAAVNDAKQKADTTLAEETRKMMQDMGLPADTNLPF